MVFLRRLSLSHALTSTRPTSHLTPLTSQSTQFGFQDVDTIAAIHGTGTAKVDGKSFVKVQQSVALPGYADKASVFVNGWRANYPDSDHHLINVGTGIGNTKTAQVEVLKSGGYRTLRFSRMWVSIQAHPSQSASA